MSKVQPEILAEETQKGKITVKITAPAGGPISFFNRLSLVDPATKKRILPVFYDDNYVSVLPGESRTVVLEYTPANSVRPMLALEGWNLPEQFINISGIRKP
jgi:hypothetical protein